MINGMPGSLARKASGRTIQVSSRFYLAAPQNLDPKPLSPEHELENALR